MGRILFAAPGIDRFHLHHRLARETVRRGHEVETVLLDRTAHTFWCAQGERSTLLEPERADFMRAPIQEFAELECRRLGVGPQHGRHRPVRQRIEHRLGRLLPPIVRWLSHRQPELVVAHGERTAERRLLQFVARELGCRVLWTGDGLLPHTMQFDEAGLDAEARAARRSAFDYRAVQNRPELLEASLANLLARAMPFPLSRSEVHPPPLRRRIADAVAGAPDGLPAVLSALRGWRTAEPVRPSPRPPFALPTEPFVSVLLQSGLEERVRLDGGSAPSPNELVAATSRAALALDPRLRIVAVLPEPGLHHRELRAVLGIPGVTVVDSGAAPEAATTAVATTTVNHPLAIAALLAGTPVLHTGRALYGLPSVTHHTPTAGFAATLARAVTADDPASLRQRMLTWILGHTHLWCSPTHPDHNGLMGTIEEIERRLAARAPRGMALNYRTGPAWPLSV